MPSTLTPAAVPAAASTSRSSVLSQALLAAVLGVVLLFGVGFSHLPAVHNAAHDTRHSAGFPCH